MKHTGNLSNNTNRDYAPKITSNPNVLATGGKFGVEMMSERLFVVEMKIYWV